MILCILAPVIAPYPYDQMDPINSYADPSWQHLFGCDKLGRDLFSRILYGGRYTISLGISAQLFGLCIGLTLGCIAGYFGGFIDSLIMRLCDVWQSIPGMLLTIIISSALGNGWLNTVLAMGIGCFAAPCRMIRAQFLSLREQEYIEAAKAINCSKPRQMFKHLLPNAIAPIIVQVTMGIGYTMIGAASLSYLGLGVQPPMPEWGALLTEGRSVLRYHPHLSVFPGLCIAIVVLSLNMFGDGLRDALDPKLKN